MNARRMLGSLKSALHLLLGGSRGYLTEHEVVRRTGTSPEKLREWEHRGLLRPYARGVEKLYRPEQLDVARWLIREERVRWRSHRSPVEGATRSGLAGDSRSSTDAGSIRS